MKAIDQVRFNELTKEVQLKYDEYQNVQNEILEEGAGFAESHLKKLKESYRAWQEAANHVHNFLASYAGLSKYGILNEMKAKYKDADEIVLEIDSHLASGLTLTDIKECLDGSPSIGNFIGCVESKKY